jgi:hypothetical protein
VTAEGLLTVDRESIRGVKASGQVSERDRCLALPAVLVAFDASGEVEGKGGRGTLADPVQLEDEMVTVGAEFNFKIAQIVAHEKQLDDFIVPELIGRAGGLWRRWVAVVGGIDIHAQHVALHGEMKAGVLVGGERDSIPRMLDFEIHGES